MCVALGAGTPSAPKTNSAAIEGPTLVDSAANAKVAAQPVQGSLDVIEVHIVGGSHRRMAPKLRSRKLFETTKKDEKAIAAPAIKGLSSPAAAIGIAATL
jgi:hypothetical protein